MSNYNSLQFEEIKNTIANYCAFSLGKQRILEAQPDFKKLTTERELKRTKEAIDLVVRYGSFPMGGVSDITCDLNNAIKEITLSANSLYSIARHAYACDSIVNYLKKADIETEEVKDLVYSLTYSIELSKEIERCITPDGEVNDNASVKLKSLKKDLKICESDLVKEANTFIRLNSHKVSDDIVTQRNDRYVVLVKTSEKNSVGGFVHGASNSGQTTYLEPEGLLNLNNKRQTIISEIEEEIARILRELTLKTKKNANNYLSNVFTLSIIDSLNAKAMWAKDNDGCIAHISDRVIFNNARHPLIDKQKCVKNSYHLENKKKVLLISGPNTGGKTVSLKIIGLFSLLTLAGFPVLCTDAEIPLFDNVFVDIGDEQSIVDDLSTFSAHIKKIAYICDNATKDSLVLLDEPGDGTDPKEGECLAIAIIDKLRETGCMTAVTTHFTRLKTYGNKYDSVLTASVEFDNEELKPTYRFIEGITGQSNALEIATKLGLNKSIINRANELVVSSQTREESLIKSLEVTLAEARRKEDALNIIRKELKAKESELNNKINIYTNQKEKLLKDAKKEAEEYVNNKIKKADSLVKEMLNADKVHEVIDLRSQLEETIEENYEEEIIENHEFVKDDYVSIKGSNQKGIIEDINSKKAIVNVNGLKITAKLNDLIYAGVKPKEVKEKTYYSVNKPSSLSFELNLIGKHVDEAIVEIDNYIDQAILIKAPFVRIIHGYGSGALRKAVWDHLKNNKYVESMRYGNSEEGSTGATVVTFKK